MSTEQELVENQHFSVAPTADQMGVVKAKELLKRCEEYVNKATLERDYFAFALQADIKKFLESA